MKKYNIVSVVSDSADNTYSGEIRGSYATEEEARKHLPSVEAIKAEMRKEKQQGARYSDTTAFEYVLEKEDEDDDYGTPEELDRHTVFFAEIQ